MKSENYTVGPTARSDGLMRIFHVDTRYGKYDFDGVEFTKLRLREIEATAALEKMSKSEAWVEIVRQCRDRAGEIRGELYHQSRGSH